MVSVCRTVNSSIYDNFAYIFRTTGIGVLQYSYIWEFDAYLHLPPRYTPAGRSRWRPQAYEPRASHSGTKQKNTGVFLPLAACRSKRKCVKQRNWPTTTDSCSMTASLIKWDARSLEVIRKTTLGADYWASNTNGSCFWFRGGGNGPTASVI